MKDTEEEIVTLVKIKGGEIILYKDEIYTPKYWVKYFDMK